jgi:hypothetical protein
MRKQNAVPLTLGLAVMILGWSPTSAGAFTRWRNCSFNACINKCNPMPSDPYPGGPKANCFYKCLQCKYAVTPSYRSR